MLTYKKQRKENANRRKGLVVYYHQDSAISEQYRRIYTNIKYSSQEAYRSVLVTSAVFGEGKSTTTINMAAAIAQLGEKVLVIDANLRNPAMHKLFKMENNLGLSNILMGKGALGDTINHTSLGTLDILTSGPMLAGPAKLLASKAMNNLMMDALNAYDMVLIDTPPYLEVTDANILANICSGVLFVAQYGKTKAVKVEEAKRSLELSGTKVIGSILNAKGK